MLTLPRLETPLPDPATYPKPVFFVPLQSDLGGPRKAEYRKRVFVLTDGRKHYSWEFITTKRVFVPVAPA